ncbi:MAG: PKD domain-containing protein [Dehalococcoidia bacterium]
MRHRRFLLPALTAFLVALLGAFPGSLRAQTAAVDQPFVVTPPAGAEAITPGVELTMTVRAPEPGKNYVWVFGDGSRPVAGTTVKHTYRGVDDYTVKLSAQAGGAQAEIGAMPLRVSPVLRGVYASDADSQITPADLFQMAVVVHAPGLSAVTVRTAGAIVAPRTTAFDVTGEDDWLVLPDMRIADERDPIIQQEIIRRPGSRLPLDKGMFTLALDTTSPPPAAR